MRPSPTTRAFRAALLAASLPAAALTGRAAPAAAQRAPAADSAHRAILLGKLRRDLAGVAERAGGVVGLAFVDLTDGTTVGVNERLLFPTASAIKVALLVELLRQAETRPGLLRERVPITAATRTGGSGVLAGFSDGGSELAVEDLAVLMMALSDNGATNLLIGRVGMDSVNRTLHALGLGDVRLQRPMIRQDLQASGRENLATPAAAAALMARIARCELPLSPAGCARLRALMELPREETVRAVVPATVRVASKGGDLAGVRTSWAWVDLPGRPFVLVGMGTFGEGSAEPIREAARLALDYAGRLATAAPYGARISADALRRARPEP